MHRISLYQAIGLLTALPKIISDEEIRRRVRIDKPKDSPNEKSVLQKE